MSVCCGRYYNNVAAHWCDSLEHDYCQSCDEHFDDNEELQDHYMYYCSQDVHGLPECPVCDNHFESRTKLNTHIRRFHNYCDLCRRNFGDEHALDQHLNSDIHKPKDKECPFCRRGFSSFGSIASHIESSGCKNFATNPTKLCELIRRWEVAAGHPNLFTRPRITDGTTRGHAMPSEQFNLDAWYCYDNNAYECPLCDCYFSSVSNLCAHINSSVHAMKNYHCACCRREFVSLAALILHMERSQCRTQKSNAIGSLISGMKAIRF
ncbi:hypothetical protein HK105_206536 [Polyrhizophydium stewartii]|uniref:C2H2-type domain-containing protein n=1 Tax=Polyrhizophydium stewartii TaxID=2732419 RepID=A0ABR4N354_9FUNG